MSIRTFNRRLSAFNAMLFIGSGIQLPFLPLWLSDRGLPAGEIAIVMAAIMAVRMLANPVGTYIADRHGNRRRVIAVAATLSFLCFGLLALMHSFLPILVTAVVAAALFAPVVPLAEAFAIEGSGIHGLDYGRIRLWASLSFLTGSLVAGALLDRIAAWWVVYLIIAAQGLAAAATLILPADPARRGHGAERPGLRPVAELMRAGPFFIFLAAAGIGQASHGLFYAFGSVIWDHAGLGKFTIGALWATGVMAEVSFFALSARLASRLGPSRLIMAGIAGGLLRWVIYGFGPPLWLLYAASALHAASFALTHLGSMHYIQQNSPPAVRNTVQGIFSSLSGGLLMSAVMWASGPLYGALGAAAYFAMAGISAIALGLAITLVRLSPTEQAAADT